MDYITHITIQLLLKLLQLPAWKSAIDASKIRNFLSVFGSGTNMCSVAGGMFPGNKAPEIAGLALQGSKVGPFQLSSLMVRSPFKSL